MRKASDAGVVLRSKVAVCGDATVGKTALVNMFTSKGSAFPKSYKMTAGVEVVVSQVTLPEVPAVVELYIYDAAGQDVLTEAMSQYLHGIYHVILVYDITSHQSFDSCKKWLDLLKISRADKDRAINGVLVGTKADLPTQRHEVDPRRAEEWAASVGLESMQVSAAPPGKDYDAPFLHIAKAFHNAYEDKLASYVNICRSFQNQ